MGNMAEVAETALEEMLRSQGVERKEGDFIHDGLLHCGKCRQKKQTRVSFADKTHIVRCMCKCDAEAREEEENQRKYEEEMRRIEKLRSASLMEAKLRDVTLSTFTTTKDNQKLYTVAKRYVENFDEMYKRSQGLLFWGPVGTGKSYTAACIANELLSRRVPVIMTSFVKILQNIQNMQVDESEFIARINSASLLVIDDLGTERNTDYALEKVYNIIDSRYLTGKPLILTTNLQLSDMQNCQDTRYKRIYDRIFEMCYPYRVSGTSWRVQQAAHRFNDMKELLEG